MLGFELRGQSAGGLVVLVFRWSRACRDIRQDLAFRNFQVLFDSAGVPGLHVADELGQSQFLRRWPLAALALPRAQLLQALLRFLSPSRVLLELQELLPIFDRAAIQV